MRLFYIILGFLCVALGSVGVVLPVLPTVPFLLAASFCFAKGSQRFHDWFVSTKLYKNNLESLAKSGKMTRKQKINILGFATFMLLLAFIFIDNIHSRIAIIVVLVLKYYYFIFRIKTLKGHPSNYDQ